MQTASAGKFALHSKTFFINRIHTGGIVVGSMWDRDGIHVGFRWDPGGIVMGSRWDPGGIVTHISLRVILPPHGKVMD